MPVGYDLVPGPQIMNAALQVCRWLNDSASAVCIPEVVKDLLRKPTLMSSRNLVHHLNELRISVLEK